MAKPPRRNSPAPPPPLNPFQRWMKRLRNTVRQMVTRGDFTALFIVWALMVLPVLALTAADWAGGMLTLLIIVTFSVGFGYILAWSRLSEFMSIILSTFYGILMIVGTMVLFLADGGNPVSRTTNFVERTVEWFSAVSEGGAGTDNIVFVFFLAIVLWFLGHNSTWHVFRLDRVWRAVIPPGMVLVINNYSYKGSARLEFFLVAYVFLAMLLVVRSHVDAREYEWYRNKVKYSRDVRKYFLRIGATLAAVFIVIGFLLPTGNEKENLERSKAFLNSISRFTEVWNRLFSKLESTGVSSPEYYGGDRLELGGAIQLGEEPVLEVTVANTQGVRYYWRSTVFDTYIAGGWDHSRAVRATKEDDGLRLNIGETLTGSRTDVEQTIRILLTANNLVYSAPQPVEYGLPVKVELDCVTAPGSFECVNQGLEVDAAIAKSIEPVRVDDTYPMVSSVSIAGADALRSAGTDYPGWVTEKYLQGVGQVTPRLAQLTTDIIAASGATTPYDQAKAIERWLRQNIAYNESIPAPPPGVDPVDWAVFDLKEGYCNYYASAMILMLRTIGIPSRMAAGFSEGEFNPSTNTYLVRERDAHTWVEVYFPGHGWVEFEPTADEQPLEREGDSTPEPPNVTATPFPTATPTAIPTNTPNPQDQPQQTPTPTPQQPEQDPLNPPTATPTPTPTPIPPVPQETKVDSDSETPNILKIFFWFILVLVVTILVLAGGVAFTIWWVEHRGLGGLNLIEKAYARMGIYGKWLGINLIPEETPEERRQELVKNVPEGKKPINDITELYVENRFAPPRSTTKEADETEAKLAWGEARMAFIRRKFQKWFGRA